MYGKAQGQVFHKILADGDIVNACHRLAQLVLTLINLQPVAEISAAVRVGELFSDWLILPLKGCVCMMNCLNIWHNEVTIPFVLIVLCVFILTGKRVFQQGMHIPFSR